MYFFFTGISPFIIFNVAGSKPFQPTFVHAMCFIILRLKQLLYQTAVPDSSLQCR
jgi:hypothetical protein